MGPESWASSEGPGDGQGQAGRWLGGGGGRRGSLQGMLQRESAVHIDELAEHMGFGFRLSPLSPSWAST